jgi:hypothetical protein
VFTFAGNSWEIGHPAQSPCFRIFAQVRDSVPTGRFATNLIGVGMLVFRRNRKTNIPAKWEDLWDFNPAKSPESMRFTSSERLGAAYLREILAVCFPPLLNSYQTENKGRCLDLWYHETCLEFSPIFRFSGAYVY